MNNVYINKSSHIGRVVARTHVDESVAVSNYAISAIVDKDDIAWANFLDLLTISITHFAGICKGSA